MHAAAAAYKQQRYAVLLLILKMFSFRYNVIAYAVIALNILYGGGNITHNKY